MEPPRATPRDVDLTSFLAYNTLVVPAAVGGYQLARFTNEKARIGLEGRSGLRERFEARAEALRGCVWFHASSAGEYEQGRPIIRALRAELERRNADIPTLLTVFSPSGHGHAARHPETDVVDYLPLDTAPAARRMMRTLQPRALVFVKFDAWPNTVWAARRAGVPLLLLDANFHRKSQRMLPVARAFFGRLFDCFSQIGAVAEADATRFREGLGVDTPITVTGDTRVDQVVHRWEQAEGGSLHPHFQDRYRYLVLGSLWPSDEAVVLEPFLEATVARPDVGLLLVPHEPTPEHLERLEAAAARHGLVTTRLSELIEPRTHIRRSTAAAGDPSRWRTIVVDSVGILAELYRAGIVSYVGGSFSTGVHNVLEPAVTAQPVLMGPRIHNAYEAECLLELGSGFVVETPDAVRTRLAELLDQEESRRRAGERAQRFVLEQSGATERSLDLLLPYLFDDRA